MKELKKFSDTLPLKFLKTTSDVLLMTKKGQTLFGYISQCHVVTITINITITTNVNTMMTNDQDHQH